MRGNVKTYDTVNILRIVCAYLVIILHTKAFDSFGDAVRIFTSEFICRIAVPFFFITSGYFLYSKISDEGYFRKYLKNIIKIYVIVTIIYSIFYLPFIYGTFIDQGIGYTLKVFLVNGISNSLWYFPALIISVAFVYIFLRKNLINTLIVISICLLLIGLMGDSYYGLIRETPFIHIIDSYNYIFDKTRNGITFGVPFITIGALINRYQLNEKIRKPLILFILFVIVYSVEVYVLAITQISKDHNMYVSLALIVPIIFIMALNSKLTISDDTSKYMREMSLWIYALHELLLSIVIFLKILSENTILNYLLICGITTLIAFIITKFKLKKVVLNKVISRRIVIASLLAFIIPLLMIIKH